MVELVWENLAEVLGDFLESEQGRNFKWSDRHARSGIGSLLQAIVEEPRKGQTERASISISLAATGEVEIQATDWELEGGIWQESETRDVGLSISPENDAADTAARVLHSLMSMRGHSISNDLNRYVNTRLAPDNALQQHWDSGAPSLD